MGDITTMTGTMFKRDPIDAPFGIGSLAGIEDALADVTAALPEGWFFKSLQYVPGSAKRARRSGRGGHWVARAIRRGDLGLPSAGFDGTGRTPQDALVWLARHLGGVNREKAAELAAFGLDDA